VTEPLTTVVDALAALGRFSDPLAWAVVGVFLAVAVVERQARDRARPLAVFAWLLFGLFWLSTVYHFTVVQKSAVEGLATLLAVPACVSVAVSLARGRDSLFVLSRSVAVAGVLFLPVQAVGAIRRPLVESVTVEAVAVVRLLGLTPEVVSGLTYDGVRIAAKQYPYRSTLVFFQDGAPLTLTVNTACTGIGSIAIFGGLVAAVDAPLDRKLRALAVSVPIIYVLNLARVVFIAVAFGSQRLHVFPDVVSTLFAVDSEVLVSYYVADRVIAQSASVVVLVGITWLVVARLPELLEVVEDALYVLTRREYDLHGLVGPDVRTDGGGVDSE